VVERMADPKITSFRFMILDEKFETIDKSTQEAVRAREEMIVAKAT
jgi:hypothetical protein